MKSNKRLKDKRREVITDIILTYANTPLKGTPKNLCKTYNALFHNDPLFTPDWYWNQDIISFKTNLYIALSKVNDPSSFDLYAYEVLHTFAEKNFPGIPYPFNAPREHVKWFLNDDNNSSESRANQFYESLFQGELENARKEVFGYSLEVYECPCNEWHKKLINSKLLKGPNRLKCYECDQVCFVHMLNSITSGKSYKEIADFNVLPEGYRECKSFNLSVNGNNKELHPIAYLYTGGSKFPGIFNGLISSLLVEFLSDHDFNRKRFKRCPYCKQFFIANDAKRKICYSPKCFSEYKRLYKQYQRDSDPGRYV